MPAWRTAYEICAHDSLSGFENIAISFVPSTPFAGTSFYEENNGWAASSKSPKHDNLRTAHAHTPTQSIDLPATKS